MVSPPSSLPPALHSHPQLLAESGGALVRSVVPAPDQTRFALQRAGTRIRLLEFIEVHNEQPKPFVWTKSADVILDSIGRFASRTMAARPNNMSEINDSVD